MRNVSKRDAILVVVAMLPIGLVAQVNGAEKNPRRIKVMTFNVLCSFCKPVEYGTWKERVPYIQDVFARHKPDLIGVQELVNAKEVEQFKELLGDVEAVFFQKGSMAHPDSAVFYRTDRFELIESGVYWLSPTPDKPFSTGFIKKMHIARCVVWAIFKDLEGGGRFYFASTHFDPNRPNQSHSAPLVLERAAQRAADLPIIITGDFNSNPDSKAYTILTQGLGDGFRLVDTYDLSPKKRIVTNKTPEPAYNAPGRIDHVFIGGKATWHVRDWAVDMYVYGPSKRYPSDHFAIVVELDF